MATALLMAEIHELLAGVAAFLGAVEVPGGLSGFGATGGRSTGVGAYGGSGVFGGGTGGTTIRSSGSGGGSGGNR